MGHLGEYGVQDLLGSESARRHQLGTLVATYSDYQTRSSVGR